MTQTARIKAEGMGATFQAGFDYQMVGENYNPYPKNTKQHYEYEQEFNRLRYEDTKAMNWGQP